MRSARLSLPKMLSVANSFEISDFQEDETAASLARRSECYIAENRWREFLRYHRGGSNTFSTPICHGTTTPMSVQTSAQRVHDRLYPGRCKQELVRRGVPDEAHVDDHRGRRRVGHLEMVPGAIRSAGYPSCP